MWLCQSLCCGQRQQCAAESLHALVQAGQPQPCTPASLVQHLNLAHSEGQGGRQSPGAHGTESMTQVP